MRHGRLVVTTNMRHACVSTRHVAQFEDGKEILFRVKAAAGIGNEDDLLEEHLPTLKRIYGPVLGCDVRLHNR